MQISQLYKKKKTVLSFEIFPPKKEADIQTIYSTIEQLKDLRPDFISVTYSAGGTGNGEKTAQIASLLKNEYGIESVAHLTCITADQEKIHESIETLKKNGVENVLALRGDLPADFTGFKSYSYAKDLIADIKQQGGMCIGAAAYPEGHIDCVSMADNIAHLRQKVDAGADFFLTQLFFDNAVFYNFLEKVRGAGIYTPISAGVMPILGKQQIQRMIFMCGASLPSSIIKLLNKYENSPEDLRKASIDYAANQVRELIEYGVDGVHIYTMNQPDIARRQMQIIRGETYAG